jgi:hypothetical protein
MTSTVPQEHQLPKMNYEPELPYIFMALRESFWKELKPNKSLTDEIEAEFHTRSVKEFIDWVMLMAHSNAFTKDFGTKLAKDLMRLPGVVTSDAISIGEKVSHWQQDHLGQLVTLSTMVKSSY